MTPSPDSRTTGFPGPSIAFVGAGPTTLYTLAAFLKQRTVPASITVFEQQPTAGLGAPYRPGWNDAAMLANIASVEIPPIRSTLLAWLQTQDSKALAALNVRNEDLHDRAFLPRLVLGRYFAAQFEALIQEARRSGLDIEVRTGSRVIDAFSLGDRIRLTIAPRLGFVTDETFDHVVLATGHQWPQTPEIRPGYFLTPWPASNLATVPAGPVGIRGTSLTAIDTAVAIALAHGAFVETDSGLDYRINPGSEDLALTLMSRKGVLPEADFYFPLPHPPLRLCTPEAVESLILSCAPDLLDQVFTLFKAELALADPDYAQALQLETANLEDFGQAYFAERAASDPFVWAKANLDESRLNHARHVAVPWRCAILRLHEVVGAVAPHLDAATFDRFERCLKPVLVDNYGAVPHASIVRLLALHRAGRLAVLALGDDYRIDTNTPACGAVLETTGGRQHYPVFIEATGQRPLPAADFPFPGLRTQGIIVDQADAGDPSAVRGVAIDEAFHPVGTAHTTDRLFCLSLPYIMGRHPFAQGITSSHEMGEQVGQALAQAVAAADSSPKTAEAA